jgi:hypothetical protein
MSGIISVQRYALRVQSQKVATGLTDFRITEQELCCFLLLWRQTLGKVKKLCEYNQFICSAALTGTECLPEQPLWRSSRVNNDRHNKSYLTSAVRQTNLPLYFCKISTTRHYKQLRRSINNNNNPTLRLTSVTADVSIVVKLSEGSSIETLKLKYL